MRLCLFFVLFCVPCYAEKIASNFKEAEYLALKNESFLKYKVIRKSIMNENNLKILEWCIEESDAWNGTSFDLVFELNYQGEITRSFKSVESPVADCFISNIKKGGYPETRELSYYVKGSFILENVPSSIPKYEVRVDGFPFDASFKRPNNFKEAKALAAQYSKLSDYADVSKKVVNGKVLNILKLCLDKFKENKGPNFEIAYELNLERNVIRIFKSIESSVADCFVSNHKLNISKNNERLYYVLSAIFVDDITSSNPSIKSKIKSSPPLTESQKKWLDDNVLEGF